MTRDAVQKIPQDRPRGSCIAWLERKLDRKQLGPVDVRDVDLWEMIYSEAEAEDKQMLRESAPIESELDSQLTSEEQDTLIQALEDINAFEWSHMSRIH
jgi:hypothetical protein